MKPLNSAQSSCIPLNQQIDRDVFNAIQSNGSNTILFNTSDKFTDGTELIRFGSAQLGPLKPDATNNKLIPQREVQISKPEAENTHRSFETYTKNALKNSFGLDDNEISRIVNHLKASAILQQGTRYQASSTLIITYCSDSEQYLFYRTSLNESRLLALTDEDQVWIQKIVSTLRAKKIPCAHVKIVLNIHWEPEEARLRWHDDQFKGFSNTVAAIHTCVVKSPDLHSSTSDTSQESHTVELGLINGYTNTQANGDYYAYMSKPAGGVATIKDDAIEKLALNDGTVIFDKDNGFQNADRLESNDPIIYRVVSISEQKHTGYFIDQRKRFVAANGNITERFKMIHSAGPLRCTPPKELPKNNEELHRFLDDPDFTCREVMVIRTIPTPQLST